jgi:hypothetical protein
VAKFNLGDKVISARWGQGEIIDVLTVNGFIRYRVKFVDTSVRPSYSWSHIYPPSTILLPLSSRVRRPKCRTR